MRVRADSIQNLISSINLQEHLRRFLEVKRSGQHAVVKCPFHEDKSPSLYIYPDHYHCFSCKAHGTIIDYEMHRTGLSFREALEQLANMYNISIEFEVNNKRIKNEQLSLLIEQKNNFLLNLQSFFKKNPRPEKQFLEYNIKNYHFMADRMLQNIEKLDVLYSGNNESWQDFLKKQVSFFGITEMVLPLNEQIQESFVFCLYSENGRLSGFAFSKNLIDFIIYTPFYQLYLPIINWQKARAIAVRQQIVFITGSMLDLISLISIGIENSVFCLQKKISLAIINVFKKKVKKIILVHSKKNPIKNNFLWETFCENIISSEIIIEVFLLPELFEKEEKISLESFKLNLISSKNINEEIVERLFIKIPNSQRLEVFCKKLLPFFNKIADPVLRNLQLESIARKYFGSSQQIFRQERLKISGKENESITSHQASEKPVLYNNKQDQSLILHKVITFYERLLEHKQYIFVKDYLASRGILEIHCKKWRLGFCPPTHELAHKVKTQAVSLGSLLALGVLKQKRNRQEYFDFFYDRIVIPIFDHQGEPVALAGRILKDKRESPKYINSHESALFSKSNILFNFHHAVTSILQKGYAIVVEGYMDCMTLVNFGVSNVVAVMGTALTNAHTEALAKVSCRVVICFDNDEAGRSAAKRSFAVAFPKFGLELECLVLPNGKDPDEFVRQNGKEKFLSLVDERSSLLKQVCDWSFADVQGNQLIFFEFLKENILPIIVLHEKNSVQDEAFELICQRFLPTMNKESLKKRIVKVQKKIANSSLLKSSFEKQINEYCWPAKSSEEVKFILTLFYARFLELPARLQTISRRKDLEEQADTDEALCASALKQKTGSVSFLILRELLSIMQTEPEIRLFEKENIFSENLSSQTQILFACQKKDVVTLLKYGLQELLKTEVVNQSKTNVLWTENILDVKNMGILSLYFKNIQMLYEKNLIQTYVLETLLRIEIDYIDSLLKSFSSFHFNDEVNSQFQFLVKARERKIGEQSKCTSL